MKHSKLLAVAIIITFVLAALPAQQVSAAQNYSEKLTGYVAGSSALWYLSFSGVNASGTQLAAVEAIQGVNSYNLTAIQTTGWTSDSQVFGPNGYNLIPVPFIPSQGVFLTVGASSYADAASAASAFDSYLLTSLISFSNGTNSYAFYGPLSFGDIVPSTLLRSVPSSMGGFASVISPSNFVAFQSPIVTLAGQRGASGFSRTLVLGSIATNALDTNLRPNFLKFFGTTISSLRASDKSTSSSIDFRFLDGAINSTDHAAVSHSAAGSGSYTLSLAPNQKITSINATVVQQPPQLLARRFLDTGVLNQGQNVSVTISLSDLSNSTALSHIRLDDSWWKSYGFFKLVNGNSTIALSTLAAGTSSTPTYVLQYTGTGTQQITIQPSLVSYSYLMGTGSFNGTATLNPALIYLGSDEPAVFAYVVPTGGVGKPIGSNQQFQITAKNVGSRAASSVVIAGQSTGGLAADGGTASVTVSVGATSLLTTNITKLYTVSYSTPEGQSVSVVTNPAQVFFSHSAMKIGFPTLATRAVVSYPTSGGGTNLTLSYTVANLGSANVTSFTAEGALPAGLDCGTTKGSGLACASGRVTLSYPRLTPKALNTTSMVFILTSPANYIFSPLSYRGETSGFNLTAESNAVAAPSGFTLMKRFNPSQLFPGMASTVTVNGVNSGPFAVYNTTVQSSADSFDHIPTGVPIKFSQTIAPRGNVTFTYSAVVDNTTYGNIYSAPATAKVFFGGTPYTLSAKGPRVGVYHPVGVTIQTAPASPIEGRAFSIGVTLNNPSNVTVSNVRFTLPIPGGMALSQIQNAAFSGGTLSVSTDQLAPGSSFVANMTAQASSGLTVLFSSGHLTFQYSGLTLNGTIPNKDIVVGEDVLTRYTLPTLLVLVAVVATAFYVRRKAPPSVPASQQ